jgi:S-adenosylmethionine hydrolase
MTVITLLTDFGLRDGYVGVMKGVIHNIAPQVQIADISHAIPPQNVALGALALKRVAPYFPDGTIHVGVVDPGVGTARRPIAGQVGSQYFVVPDNGLATMLIQRARENGEVVKVVHLEKPQYWLDEISNVFHGRDIFSPCGAHLAAGVPLEELGSPIDDYMLLDIPGPERTPQGGWRGHVLEVDFFGNLSTNIERGHVEAMEPLSVRIAGVQIDDWVNTFGERPVGSLISLYGTTDDVMISVVNGNAAERLGVGLGAEVEVLPQEVE